MNEGRVEAALYNITDTESGRVRERCWKPGLTKQHLGKSRL